MKIKNRFLYYFQLKILSTYKPDLIKINSTNTKKIYIKRENEKKKNQRHFFYVRFVYAIYIYREREVVVVLVVVVVVVSLKLRRIFYNSQKEKIARNYYKFMCKE